MTIIEQAQKTQEPGLIQQSKQEQTEEITEQTQTILDDLFQIQKEKAFSFEEIMKFMEQVGYKIIQVLGSGAFGKVIQVIDKETQIQYACKFLPSKQEYQQEKEIQQQLLDIFGDQIEEITEQLEDSNDEEQILFYQAGDCSLQEYMSWMNKLGIYWFENLQQFNGFIYKAYQLLNILFDKEVYQSDIKPDNIIIRIDNEFQEIEPKIIDFGVSSLDGFSKIYGYTPSFAIDPKIGLTHLNEKKDRIFWELYQFGRTIMYLMISSVEGKIKNQINQFDFLHQNFMVSEQQLKISFQNDRQTISQTIQLLQNYYPKYLIELLQFLLLQEQSQFSISKLEEKMQMLKDNMRPMVDTQNIVGQIIANRITSRIKFDIGKAELEKEINDCFELEMFNNCILFIKLYFQKFKLIKNPYLARIYIFLLQIQGKQKEKQEFLKKITKDVKVIWKKINLKQYYLIKLQFLFILNRKEKGFIKIIQKMLTILKQLKQVNYYSEEYQIGLIIYLNKLLPMSDPESWKLFKDYNLHTPSDIKEDINNFVREQQFNSKHFYQLQIYRAMLNFDYDSKTLISFRKNQKIITNLKSIEEKMKQQELSRSYIMGILYNALGFLLQHQINHIFNQDQNIDLNKFEDKFVSYIDLKKSVEQAQLVKLAEDYQIELEYFLKTAIAIFQKSIGVNNIYQFSTHKLLINSLLKFEKFTECFKLCTLYMIELEKNPHLIQEDDFQQSAKLYISIYHQKRMQKNKNKLFQQKVQNPNVQQFKQIQQQRDSIFDHAQNDEDHVQQIQQLMHISLGLEDENEELQAKINHKKSFLIEYQKVPINKVREDDLKQSLNQNKTPKFAQKPNHQLKFNNEQNQTRKNSLELVVDILKPILNKEENQFQINLTPSPKQNNQENYQQQNENDNKNNNNNNNNNINSNNNNNNNNNKQFLFPSKKSVNQQSEDSVSVSGVSENSSFLQQENSDYQSVNSFSQNDISCQNSQEQDQIDDNTSLSDLGLHKQKMRNLYQSQSMSSISGDQEIDLDLASLFNLKNQEEQAIKEKFIEQTNHRLKKKLLKKSYFAYLQENFNLSLIYQKIYANLEQSVINRIQIKLIKLRQQLNDKEYSTSYIKLCQKGLSYVQYKQQYIKEQQQEQKQVESQERYQKIHQNDKFFIYQKLFECLIYLGHYEQVSKIYLQQKRFFRKFQYRQTVMKIYTVYALYLNCNFQDCLNLLLETLYSKHISQPQHYYQKIALNAIIQIVTNNSSHKSSKLKITEQKKQIFFQTNKNQTELQFLMNRIKKKYTEIFANKFDNILFNSAEENPKIIQQQEDNQTIKKSPNTYYIETQIKVYQEEINRPDIQIEEIEEMKKEYKQFVEQVSQSPTFYQYKQPILYLQTLIDRKYIMHLEDEKALLQSNYSNKQNSQFLPPLHEKAKSSQNIENSYYTSASSKSLFGRQAQISRISQKIGRTFYENKNYQKAQQHYQSALQEAKEEKDKIQQIRIQYQQQQNLEMQRIQQIMKYQVQRKKVESSFY